MLKDLLWVGAVLIVPGLGIALLAKKIANDLDENAKFKEHVRKTYGSGSKYDERN